MFLLSLCCVYLLSIFKKWNGEHHDPTIQPRSYHQYSNNIDASPKKPIDKEQLLELLQSHGVKTDSINNLKTTDTFRSFRSLIYEKTMYKRTNDLFILNDLIKTTLM